jgi:outer membrane lipoprotein-sorting protein
MSKKFLIIAMIFVAVNSVFAQMPSATDLLKKIDENEIYSTIVYDGQIIIEYQGKRYVKEMKTWARGNDDSFIEFLNPEDAGTRYLKKGGRLYVYSPDNEGVMLISGHMLKESMMGSDMSYEDAINNDTLASRYDAVISGSDLWKVNGLDRDSWVLELTAKKKTESYPTRKLWIDKQTGDLLHYELFALSGAKLKEYSIIKIEVLQI